MDHRNMGISRRRFLSITAASAAGLISSPGLAGVREYRWRGVALGAESEIKLTSGNPETARKAIEGCVRDVKRLENILSLYRRESTLSRLNRAGFVELPEVELVELLSRANQISVATNGAFDVTVQSLWRLYARHFGDPQSDPAGPAPAAIADALQLVDFRQVEVSERRVSLAKPGASITLNGIAQGFVTDRVSALLKRAGFSNLLVHFGETSGHGQKADGRPWKAGISDPEENGVVLRSVDLTDRCLATSAPNGFRFHENGPHHHLFDPRTGRSVSNHTSVSVIAPTATEADAFSTAFSGMTESQIRAVTKSWPNLEVVAFDVSGRVITIASTST